MLQLSDSWLLVLHIREWFLLYKLDVFKILNYYLLWKVHIELYMYSYHGYTLVVRSDVAECVYYLCLPLILLEDNVWYYYGRQRQLWLPVKPSLQWLPFCSVGLTSSDSMDISSTHSSPLLPHKPRDMHLQSSEHAPGKVTHCFSGLSHILSVARHILYPRSKKNKYCARLSHRLLPKKNSENRLLPFKLLYISIPFYVCRLFSQLFYSEPCFYRMTCFSLWFLAVYYPDLPSDLFSSLQCFAFHNVFYITCPFLSFIFLWILDLNF